MEFVHFTMSGLSYYKTSKVYIKQTIKGAYTFNLSHKNY